MMLSSDASPNSAKRAYSAADGFFGLRPTVFEVTPPAVCAPPRRVRAQQTESRRQLSRLQ
jgi:hypothetical protein